MPYYVCVMPWRQSIHMVYRQRLYTLSPSQTFVNTKQKNYIVNAKFIDNARRFFVHVLLIGRHPSMNPPA